MKVLSVSRLCLLGALVLGLMTAWSIATPTQLSKGDEIGGCFVCINCGADPCNDWPGAENCTGTYVITCFGAYMIYPEVDCDWGTATPCGGPPEECDFTLCDDCPDDD